MIEKIKKRLPECLPDIIICMIGLILVLSPIIIAIISYYKEDIEEIAIKEKEVKDNEIDPVVVIAIYMTKHLSNCDECTQENFPFCERAKEVVDTIMNNDVFKFKLLEED